MTVKEYYKHFWSIFGGITATISGLPVISDLLPKSFSTWLFPPVGPTDGFLRILTVILAVLTTVVVFFTKDRTFVSSKKGRSQVLCILFVPLVVAVVGYAVLNWLFVKSISIPDKDDQILVSIGYQRTPFAQREFGEADDWQLLKERGPTEQEIWRLWTAASIIITRAGLLLCYLLFLISAVIVGSLAVLYDKSGTPPNP